MSLRFEHSPSIGRKKKTLLPLDPKGVRTHLGRGKKKHGGAGEKWERWSIEHLSPGPRTKRNEEARAVRTI